MKIFKTTFIAAAGAVLVPAVFFAGSACAAAVSTATAKTDFDAIELMAMQMGAATSRAVQDHFYDGNAKSAGVTGGAVVAAAPGTFAVAAARYTGPASVYKAVAAKVPPLSEVRKTAAPEARKTPAAEVKKSAALEQPKVEAKKAARTLTPTEIESAKQVFNTKLDYSKVKVITGKDMTLWGRILTMGGKAVVWGNKIYFPNDSSGNSKYDFSKNPSWYMHEVTHVYQYQNIGWKYVPKSIWAQLTKGQGAYDYQLVPGKSFKDYGIEQQAEIVRDYYNSATGRTYVTPAERALLESTMKGEGLLQ